MPSAAHTALTRLVAIAFAASLAIASIGCAKKADAADCDALMIRLVDITIEEDPRAKGLPQTARDAMRSTSKKALFADPEIKRIQDECRSEITKAELACALKATSSAEWNACLD